MGVAIDLTGQQLGRLTVVERLPRLQRTGGVRWRCRCVCGGELITRSAALRSGKARSCGCQRTDSNTKHGLSRTPEYFAWKNMHARCSDPEHRAFASYGGRGIRVCERWSSLRVFVSDMGPRPAGHSLERIKNDEGYSPDNCRWAIPATQQRNKRNNRLVTIDGDMRTLTDWCAKNGVKPKTAWERIRRGWVPAEAVSIPAKP